MSPAKLTGHGWDSRTTPVNSNSVGLFSLRMILSAIVAGLLCLQSGCMTAGEQLDRSAVSGLQKGQTQAEVRKVFGLPKRSETGADSKRLDVYQVSFIRKVRAPYRALAIRTLCVLYNDAERVENFVHHFGELPIRVTPLGWEAGEEIDEARIRGIERERHSRNDLIYTFGPPAVEGLDRNGDAIAAWYFIRGSGGFYGNGYQLLATFDASNRVKDYVRSEIQW